MPARKSRASLAESSRLSLLGEAQLFSPGQSRDGGRVAAVLRRGREYPEQLADRTESGTERHGSTVTGDQGRPALIRLAPAVS